MTPYRSQSARRSYVQTVGKYEGWWKFYSETFLLRFGDRRGGTVQGIGSVDVVSKRLNLHMVVVVQVETPWPTLKGPTAKVTTATPVPGQERLNLTLDPLVRSIVKSRETPTPLGGKGRSGSSPPGEVQGPSS